jgi:prepilin-type processing-associated H-X9-DG protein
VRLVAPLLLAPLLGIGGVIARDPRLPQLAGRFLYGDLCTGAMRSMLYADGHVIDDAPIGPFLGEVMAFGEDGLGRIYASSLADSSLYRLDPVNAHRARLSATARLG